MAEVNGFKLLSINLLFARLATCERLFSSARAVSVIVRVGGQLEIDA